MHLIISGATADWPWEQQLDPRDTSLLETWYKLAKEEASHRVVLHSWFGHSILLGRQPQGFLTRQGRIRMLS